jgi:uncharacterized membrane protein
MAIHFNRFLPLLFIPVIAVILFITYKKYLGARRIGHTLLRGFTLLCIILSMCSIQLIQTPRETTTLFLADRSHSTLDSQRKMEAFINEAMNYTTEKDLVGIVGFGSKAVIEIQPSQTPSFSTFESQVNGEFTNIQNGLIMANALFPSNTLRRIVLMTDGHENSGDVRKQLGAMANQSTTIDFVDFSEQEFFEVQLQSIDVPEKVEKNQLVDINTTVISNVSTEATIYIYANGVLKYESAISIDQGENNFSFSDQIVDSGLVTYSAQIVVNEDTYTENNFLSTFTFVNDLPKLLVIQEEDEQGLNLIGMLENSARVDVVWAKEVPSTLEELITYDGYILANVSVESLNQEFLMHLEEAVRLQGKGLLVTGGENSYGPGGYYQTLLEELLPVNMDAKPKEEKPNLALLLVIDKSGSMTEVQYGISKIDLAKEAAFRSTDALEEKDYLGVIGFDSYPSWVLEPVKVTNKKKIETAIGVMGPGGGTSIQPALKEAVETLIDLEAGLKHIILLTDGQAETTGYNQLLDQMQNEHITLSTVAVGEGADKNLLKLLASYGNGRYYETGVFSDIPTIFTKEAFMAGKKYLNNVTFLPTLTGSSPIMTGIIEIPTLDGYVATSKKEAGKVILSGPDNDPILASWQYGLGRTVAYTSDMKGLWSKNWLAWEGNQNFWINLVSWMVQQDLNTDYSVVGKYEEGQGIIAIESLVKGQDFASIEGILTNPEGKSSPIKLEAIAPGKYQGNFDPEGQGTYLVSLGLGEGENAEQIITAVNIGYSKEFDFFSEQAMTIEEMQAISEGSIVTQAKNVFKNKVAEVKGSNDLSRLFLILGLISFMLEILLRKLKLPVSYVSQKLKDSWNWVIKALRISKRSSQSKVQLQGTKSQRDDQNEVQSGIQQEVTHVAQKKTPKEVQQKTNTSSHVEQLLEMKRKKNH